MEKEIVESKCQECNMIIATIKGRDPRRLCFYCENKQEIEEESIGEIDSKIRMLQCKRREIEKRYKESVKHILPPFTKEDNGS